MQHISREFVQYSFLQWNVIVATFVFLCLVFWSALFLFFLCFGRVCGCRLRGARTRGSSRLQSKTNIVRLFKGTLYTSVSLQSQNCYWNLTVEPFPSRRWKKNRWISSAGSKISCIFQDSIIHSLGVEWLISRLYLSHNNNNNNCPQILQYLSFLISPGYRSSREKLKTKLMQNLRTQTRRRCIMEDVQMADTGWT